LPKVILLFQSTRNQFEGEPVLGYSEFMSEQANKTAGRPARMPVVMSAFVFPGVGQFMQGRKLAGAFFALGFVALFALAIIYAFRLLCVAYGMWDSHMSENELTAFSRRMVTGVIFCAAGAAILYIANVFDAWRCQAKAQG